MFWKVVIVLLCGLITSVNAEEQRNVELLAASCAACHGTNGHSVGGTPSLASLGEQHFIEQLRQFKSGSRPSTVMLHHVNGYTDDEIKLMAEFFSTQN